MYAEESVQRVVVSFLYSVRFDEKAEVEDVIANMENYFQDKVFNDYVDCDGASRVRVHVRFRNLQWSSQTNAIGASTLPQDAPAMDLACSLEEKGEICLPVDGSLTVIYPAAIGGVNSDEEELKVLEFIETAIENFETINTDLKGADYYGKREDFNATLMTGLMISVPDTGTDGISGAGIGMISTSFILVGLALFAGDKRRKNARFERDNVGALTTLRGEPDKSDYDLYEIQPGDDDDDLDTLEGTSDSGSPNRKSRDAGMPFPLVLPVRLNGDDSDGSSNMKYYDHMQDVHHCKSATCQQCRPSGQFGERVRFIHSSQGEWYEDCEIDFSDQRGNGAVGDMDSVRTYETPNTVTL